MKKLKNNIGEIEIINKYLCQIEKGLPVWIRLKKDELNCILEEIEEHIWDKAIESAGNKEPRDIDIQIAIYQMGDPHDIASQFVNRSTPYIYISEELYPIYRKYCKIFFWSFLLWLAVFIIPNPFNTFFLFFLTFFSIFLYDIVIIVFTIFTTFFGAQPLSHFCCVISFETS